MACAETNSDNRQSSHAMLHEWAQKVSGASFWQHVDDDQNGDQIQQWCSATDSVSTHSCHTADRQTDTGKGRDRDSHIHTDIVFSGATES